MRIIITGGAGYVGSHCVRRLIDAGHRVTVFDNLVHGHRRAVDPRATFVQGDLHDARALDDVVAGGRFDAAMHFAGLINVADSVREPLDYYRANVVGSLRLLEALRSAGVHRLVFSSTCAVYGEPDDLPIVEDFPKNPISPYGASKLMVERMLSDSASAWGLGSMALRYFNAAGAAADATIGEAHHPEVHLIPVVLQVALGQRDVVQVFGTDYPTPDGSCVRDYVHVEDLAEAHRLAIESVRAGQAEAYNVGTGRGHSVLEVIAECRRVTGHLIPARLEPRRPGDPPQLFADPARIRARLGWDARNADLSSIIESAWRWHRTHPNGYEA